MFCIFDLNLVIIAWTADELSCGQQVTDTHTHGHTDKHTDAGDDNIQRQKMASDNNLQMILISIFLQIHLSVKKNHPNMRNTAYQNMGMFCVSGMILLIMFHPKKQELKHCKDSCFYWNEPLI